MQPVSSESSEQVGNRRPVHYCWGCGYPYYAGDECDYCPRADSAFALGLLVFLILGVGTEPAERLAAADRYGAVLYGRRVA